MPTGETSTLSSPPARPRPRPVGAGPFLLVLGAVGLIVAAVLVAVGSERRPLPMDSGGSIASVDNPRPTTRRATVRVAYWNIRSGRGIDGIDDIDRIARVLHGHDVIGLSELRGAMPGRDQDQTTYLARKLETDGLFAPTEERWWRSDFGNALLSSLDVLHWTRIPLPGTQDSGHRNLVLARIDIGGPRPLHLITTHIDRVIDRRQQLRIATQLFLSLEGPAVLMGDLNTTADDPILQDLLRTPGVVDAHAGQGSPERIDFLFVRGATVVASGIVENTYSDHPMVWAELRAEPGSAGPSPGVPVDSR